MASSIAHNKMTPDELLQWLQGQGERPATFLTLIELYRSSRDHFFELAYVGVGVQAPAWAKEIAGTAALVRSFVRYGFEIESSSKRVIGSQGYLYLGDAELAEAESFLREIAGTSAGSVGRDYEGSVISSSEVEFNIGTTEERAEDQRRSRVRNAAKPSMLRVDDQDIEAIKHGMPVYVLHELWSCAKRVVQAPTAVFQGIRSEGRLAAGRAYCGKPKRAFDSQGQPIEPPAGMVFCVYADPDGFVFDWDWIKEDPDRPGYPVDYHLRFKNQITELNETTLVASAVEGEPFVPGTAWHSYRGDCMFFYASDKPAYARRVNEDLTEFRAMETDELLGCKVKNFERLLSKIVQSGGSSEVPVAAVLALSLVQQMENHQRREKEEFFRLIPGLVLQLSEKKRREFFQAWQKLEPDNPDQFLEAICNLAIQFTNDTRVVQIARHVSATTKKVLKERYFELIAVAGNAIVQTQQVA